jgi:hypothetical protein
MTKRALRRRISLLNWMRTAQTVRQNERPAPTGKLPERLSCAASREKLLQFLTFLMDSMAFEDIDQ